jgi:hypothetical protein
MTYQTVLSIISIALLFFPDLFKSRYAYNTLWDAMSKSFQRDSEPIKTFFEDIENGHFGEEPRKQIVTTYFDYGFDIISLYVSLIISIGSVVASIILYNSFWIMIVYAVILIPLIIMIFEIRNLISESRPKKKRLYVYNQKLMHCLKIIVFSINIVIILVGMLITGNQS